MESTCPVYPAHETLRPVFSIAIVRSAAELALYFEAAFLAGGTTIEILPKDQTTADLFIAGLDPARYPDVDIESHVQTAIDSSAIFLRVNEDLAYRQATVPDIWQHVVESGSEIYPVWKSGTVPIVLRNPFNIAS